MINAEVLRPLDRQLLLQLGDRLKHLRKAQGLGTVEMAARVGITRNTLRAVETGDPATAIGTYLRVMSVLGVGGELALLAGDTLVPPPAGSAAARSRRARPLVEIRVAANDGRHQLQDLQSLALHVEAVRRAKADPAVIEEAVTTVRRWLAGGDPRSAGLWIEWQRILEARAWRKVLGRNQHAQQLRQASPLVTTVPDEVRRRILAEVSGLERGIALGGTSKPQNGEVASRESSPGAR